MVVSKVPPLWSPDWIKLPTVTTYRLTRPLTGAYDPRVVQVERGQVTVGPGDIEIGLGFAVIAFVPIIFFLADGPSRQQDFGPPKVALEPVRTSFVLCHGTLGPRQVSPVEARVDLEELVILMDQGPFLEVDLVEVTGDPRPHLDRLDRGRAAGEIGVVGDVPLDGIAHRDGYRC